MSNSEKTPVQEVKTSATSLSSKDKELPLIQFIPITRDRPNIIDTIDLSQYETSSDEDEDIPESCKVHPLVYWGERKAKEEAVKKKEELELDLEDALVEMSELQHQVEEAVVEKTELQHQVEEALEEKAALQHQLRQLERTLECKVCWENPAIFTYIPCGHLAACQDCAKRISGYRKRYRRCPICMDNYIITQRTYV